MNPFVLWRRHRRAPQRARRINFMHVPKCGGTTLHQLLDDGADYSRLLLPVIKDPQLQHVFRELRASAEDPATAIRDWLNGYDRFHGHTNITGILDDSWFTFTFLREPADRLVSLFNHWQAFTDEEIEGAERRNPDSKPVQDLKRRARRSTLGEFLADEAEDASGTIAWHFNNGMTNVLALDSPLVDRPAVAALGLDERRRLALDHLARMGMVGVLERMDESLAVLYDRTGLYPRRDPGRKNARNYSRDAALAGADARVDAMTQQDRELYQAAWARLDADLAELRQRLGALDMDGIYRRLEQEYENRRRAECRAQLAAGALPRRSELRMTQGLAGDGWHEREGVKGPVVYRWTGPGKESFVDLALVPAPAYKVEIDVVGVIDDEVARGVELGVNGRYVKAVAQRSWRGRLSYEAKVPGGEADADGFLRVGIRVPAVRSHSELEPGNGDKRRKGVAVTSIRIKGC